MKISVTAAISAQNTFTGWAELPPVFQLLISGLADSTVTFQGSPDGGSTVYDLDDWNASTDNGLHFGNVAKTTWVYRAGVKTGDYGTDTIILRLEG